MNTPLEHVDSSVPFYQLNVTASDSATAGGGTAAANHWVSLQNFQLLGVKVSYDTRDGGYLSSIVIEQAQDSTGTGVKTLKTFTLTSAQINTALQTVSVNVNAAEVDTANDFQFVRVKLVQTGGTTTNKFSAIYTRSAARYSYPVGHQYTLRLPQDQKADGQ